MWDENQLKLATSVGKMLKKHGHVLTIVESCTGGLASALITEIAGCSAWFDSGIVTYSNAAKQDLVNVKDYMLQAHGAVSEETAADMAVGALFQGRATITASITGIAGPTGGTKTKPVGTVCFGWAGQELPLITRTHHLTGNRQQIRMQAVEIALNGILELSKHIE